MINKNRRTLVIGAAVCIVVITLLVVLYSIFIFRVTKTTPEAKNFPTTAPYIDIYFSKSVSKSGNMTLNGVSGQGTIQVLDKKIRITPKEEYQEDVVYTLVLKGITSTSGDTINYTYVFTPKYMDFADLPEEIQKANIEQSSSGQNNDPFFNNYFPMIDQDNSFEIELVSVENSGLYVTFYDEVFNYDTNQQTQLPNDQAEALRLKVLDYIRSRGGKPENYRIEYANMYLDQKYNPDDHSGE